MVIQLQVRAFDVKQAAVNMNALVARVWEIGYANLHEAVFVDVFAGVAKPISQVIFSTASPWDGLLPFGSNLLFLFFIMEHFRREALRI
jgi:hypothetical protein